jgi:hypothetical protein
MEIGPKFSKLAISNSLEWENHDNQIERLDIFQYSM